ncbi:MAG: hypothetical protein V7K86_12440 [Nostoc sp.]|uniref:hypothetical protein n=1 Tax=Nostoc sp. TaxID=1180 RepID=UPI002FF69449
MPKYQLIKTSAALYRFWHPFGNANTLPTPITPERSQYQHSVRFVTQFIEHKIDAIDNLDAIAFILVQCLHYLAQF